MGEDNPRPNSGPLAAAAAAAPPLGEIAPPVPAAVVVVNATAAPAFAFREYKDDDGLVLTRSGVPPESEGGGVGLSERASCAADKTSPDEVVGRELPGAVIGTNARTAGGSAFVSLQSSMTESRRDCGRDSVPYS